MRKPITAEVREIFENGVREHREGLAKAKGKLRGLIEVLRVLTKVIDGEDAMHIRAWIRIEKTEIKNLEEYIKNGREVLERGTI